LKEEYHDWNKRIQINNRAGIIRGSFCQEPSEQLRYLKLQKRHSQKESESRESVRIFVKYKIRFTKKPIKIKDTFVDIGAKDRRMPKT
jgi:hypothetical protein